MMRARDLLRCSVICDGEAFGRVEGFLFDDAQWAVRYLRVVPEDGREGGCALIAPAAIGECDAEARELYADLSARQIADSPAMRERSDLPRDEEMALITHFGWPAYWADSPQLKGAASEAGTGGVAQLRSLDALCRCEALAADGQVAGAVADVFLDTTDWAVRYLAIAVEDRDEAMLAPPDWVRSADWNAGELRFGVSSESLLTGPART
ncbi:MAG: hypothetical protein GX591_01560 [Planctomycetes bacterium]|nr:hypothetical protein [Planctomycetota bacterium]